jgi:hypothetical protein
MNSEQLKERLQAHLQTLSEELKQGKSQGLLKLLETMGRFHQYSARNTVLILFQRPDATLVAGMKRWNQLGRTVKKGERAIAILAPTVKNIEVVDKATGEVREEKRTVGFHTAYIFDVSQTEGKPLELGRDQPEEAALYARLVQACPVKVQEALLPPRTMGRTNGREIQLSSTINFRAKAETLLHEWAHVALMHHTREHNPTLEELEAEAVAYAVGREIGLPMQGSRNYILMFRGTVEKLEESLDRIMRAAREILERFYAGRPALAAAA